MQQKCHFSTFERFNNEHIIMSARVGKCVSGPRSARYKPETEKQTNGKRLGGCVNTERDDGRMQW